MAFQRYDGSVVLLFRGTPVSQAYFFLPEKCYKPPSWHAVRREWYAFTYRATVFARAGMPNVLCRYS